MADGDEVEIARALCNWSEEHQGAHQVNRQSPCKLHSSMAKGQLKELENQGFDFLLVEQNPFGAALREARLAAGLTQKSVANSIGVVANVSMWETGKSFPATAEVVTRLEAVLGVKLMGMWKARR